VSLEPVPLAERGALLTPIVSPPPESATDLALRLSRLSLPASQIPEPLPEAAKRPVVTLGAGSIVRDAHAPAYGILGLERLGIFDLRPSAREAALSLGYAWAAGSLSLAVARGVEHGAVFDLALPPDAILPTLSSLPNGAAVLIQKPIGKSLADAQAIARLCREKSLRVGVNFQLPFSPQVVAAVGALRLGVVGALRSAAVELELLTNWSLWEFLLKEPRIEVLLHSIHYLSVFGYLLGEPESVVSRQWGDPGHAVFCERDVCSDTELVYQVGGAPLLCAIQSNHLSTKPQSEWKSQLVLQGEHGSIVAGISDNLDYPNGVDDSLWVHHRDFGSTEVRLVGNRFPMAFAATMAHLQHSLAGGKEPPNDLELGLLSMRLAERCYDSNARSGVPLPFADP
jgi:predicted dehydrogenase